MTHEKLLNEICKNHNLKSNEKTKMVYATYKDKHGDECGARFFCEKFTKVFIKKGELDDYFFKEFIIWIFEEMYKL